MQENLSMNKKVKSNNLLGIVVSDTRKHITSKMLLLAEDTAKKQGYQTMTIHVPGSFDIPLAVQLLLKKKEIAGVITLGVVIKGETSHDSVIVYTVAKSLIELSLKYNKPVTSGINGPDMNEQQAIARISRAKEVTEACINLITHLK